MRHACLQRSRLRPRFRHPETERRDDPSRQHQGDAIDPTVIAYQPEKGV
jgi:hypothetical protein